MGICLRQEGRLIICVRARACVRCVYWAGRAGLLLVRSEWSVVARYNNAGSLTLSAAEMNLEVVSSTKIHGKKPWPNFAWLQKVWKKD